MPRFCTPFLTIVFGVALAACDEVPDLSLPNEPPQAVDDQVELLQDFIATIDVTSNDIDVDGNIATVEVISDAQNGTAEEAGGVIVYTPERRFAGTDSFQYRVTDSKGESDEATVTLIVKQRQTRALFAADNAGVQRLYMVDSREPGGLIELTASFDDPDDPNDPDDCDGSESVRGWAYDNVQQEAIVLTDADCIVAIPLSDPAMPESFPIDLAQGESVDGGFDVSPIARRAAFSVNNRFMRTFNLDSEVFDSIDAGWTDSTMEILFYSPAGNGALMTGTLGTPPVTAFYLVPTDGSGPAQLFEGEDDTASISASGRFSSNEIVWVQEQPGMTGFGPFSCQNPPAQRLSSLSYASVLAVTNIVDLNAASGLLPDGTDIISYNPPPSTGRRVYVAACPPGIDIVQLIEISYADPSTANVLATGEDADDGFFGVDVAPGALNLIYVVDRNPGLALIEVDQSDFDAGTVVTDLTATLPQFQTFSDGADLRVPASAFSTNGQFWLFVAPDNGEPTLLTWLNVDDRSTASTTLPFATTDAPLSDGYLAFARTATEVALVRLEDGAAATAVALPGTLTGAGGGEFAVAPVVLAPVALADTP